MIRTVVLAGLVTAAVGGVAGTGAFAVSAPVPIDPSSPLYIPIGAPPPPGPGVSFGSNCPAVAQTAFAVLEFVDGNGHVYGPSTNPPTNGANVEGSAYWLGFEGNELVYAYFGHAHAWFGQNVNPTGNAQQVFAQTVMFHGTSVDDSTQSLDVQASFGGTQSASGNQNGWGHLKVTC